MPKDAPPNGSASGQTPVVGSWSRVSKMQALCRRRHNVCYEELLVMPRWVRGDAAGGVFRIRRSA